MKIMGKLVFKGERADEMVDTIAKSLAPDNLSEIRTEIGENTVTVTFASGKIGTVLSSVDDYLMNAKIACDMIEKTQRE
ncbi:MAG: KEOPS complex subunit Pcc1 [Candidatus Methanoperedens sp.]|nr:KEOPS complex subunit Pcc1 [Candidatus Methanoperedens sp.]MCZ7371689.1 KEOPS complex subunit Pcc1 [Candidatus Methanoperedens sp.]